MVHSAHANRNTRLDKQAARRQKQGRRASRNIAQVEAAVINELEAREHQPSPRKNVKKFAPLTDAQADYADAIDYSTITFGIGPAGTGKTFVAACKACDHLLSAPRTRVILTRPAVEAEGEKLGFLPGSLADKFGPYMRPLMDILIERLGNSYVESAIKNGRIDMIPMAFMRGRSFADTLIIADEMQNATKGQLKMLMTRIGEGSRLVIDGDPAQTDLGAGSGLEEAVYLTREIKGFAVVRFTRADIVRHDIIQHILEAFETTP